MSVLCSIHFKDLIFKDPTMAEDLIMVIEILDILRIVSKGIISIYAAM